ncbi:hypothetical protein SLEP1_g47829 [Rubroshorea leprosula]|uniref:non-specific serine/threonine protein kinase n=1 Tax=Rubroshorea leprosula TaxID=152421 RepID=A0AAV5LUK8_9ROSI|nr:hypothetical protein SLEP1_g47829 [Rubroshorea leprosula]
MSASSAARHLLVLDSFAILVQLLCVANAQNQSQTTDPDEARILNSIFQQWRISAPIEWNISGELCSGVALDPTVFDLGTYNPIITCKCANSTCHITQLKVYALNVVDVIPDALWNLTHLTNLDLSRNHLTGPLSASISSLTKMQYLIVDINALYGEVPKELGLLTDLIMFSNNFSGPLPSELGNCLRLEQLYIDSSGVSGDIPSTFASLKNLATVWASDTELTGRIPEFIGNWSKLKTLRFQGNSFTGPIPSTFANLTSLTELRINGLFNGSSTLEFIKDMKSLSILDLSFNDISGQIPNSLFNLSSITHLFLGNNKLNGTLPAQKSPSLLNIDVSYNNLAGSFPPWVNGQNLSLNLVANNFTIESSSNSGLPSGLNCLQRNFPCNRGSGRYYNFAIKCGGQEIRSSDGVVFERDDEILGPASYFVTDTKRWAVSNVGYFTRSQNSQSTKNLDLELFQRARISASSLRYYGLGLENGNYTVSLQFVEIAIEDSTTWQSLGKRIFDIYVQGNRVFKDFNILKEAGGYSRQGVTKDITAQVSENYLEIHLFWAGKGTCCIPYQGTYGPLISAISATPNFKPTVSNKPPSSSKSRTGLIVGVIVGVGVVSFLFLAAFFIFGRRPKTNEDEVKQLSVASRQGKSQFVTEIATISAVQHRNLVKLHGCCIEANQRLLVYEYLENKSLDQALFGKGSLNLNWQTRYDICLGVARGLAYLHEESRLRIVHRDVKASNILLDSGLIPKISDFGLAKLYDDTKTHISTRVAGTIGYLAPEYAMRGHLTEKTDVFAFGVVALEVVSGRPNSDSSLEGEKMYLLEWAWHLYENNREVELLDSNILEFDEEEVKNFIGVALLCTQTIPMQRPSMSRVVAMLSGDTEVSRVTSKPGYLTGWKFDDTTSSMSDQPTRAADTSYHTTSTSTSMVADAENLPEKAT